MLPAFAAGTAGERPSLLPNLQAAGTSVMLHCVCVPQWGKDHQLVKQSMHRAWLSHQLIKTGRPVPGHMAKEESASQIWFYNHFCRMVQLGGRTAALSEVVAVTMSL